MARQRTDSEKAFKTGLFNGPIVTGRKKKRATSEEIEKQTREFLKKRGNKITKLPSEVVAPRCREAYPWLQD